MNAHVLTTITSASEASLVISCPACSASPSITSPSTRFFGHPRDTNPIFIDMRSDPLYQGMLGSGRPTLGSLTKSGSRPEPALVFCVAAPIRCALSGLRAAKRGCEQLRCLVKQHGEGNG